MSRADSGIIYQGGGSQGDSPTPAEGRMSSGGVSSGGVSSEGVEDISISVSPDRRKSTEECTTVGSKAVGISTTSEPHHRHLAVEEALGVGGDSSKTISIPYAISNDILHKHVTLLSCDTTIM